MPPDHDWIEPDWPAPPNVRSLITTRNGGVSTGNHATLNLGWRAGDDATAVAANRATLRTRVPSEPAWLRQVHGTRVICADDVSEEVEADASVARQPGTVCAVMIADCLPVLLCDTQGSVVGVAHAGWRGLSAGVVENAITTMNVAAADVLAHLGPAIGPSAFEVGADVRDAFLRFDDAAAAGFTPHANGKWLADLFLLARQRLARCGVRQISGGGLCTYRDSTRFYSYRRDHITGRMAALVWLADK